MEPSGPQTVGSEMMLASLQTNIFNCNGLMFIFLPFMASDIGFPFLFFLIYLFIYGCVGSSFLCEGFL